MYSIFGRYLLGYCIFAFFIIYFSQLPLGGIAMVLYIVFWGGMYFAEKWNLYYRELKGLNEHSLNGLEGDWIRRHGWQKTSEIMKVRYAGNDAKTLIALNRILSIQEELLIKQRPNNEQWAINSVESLKQRIHSTKKEILTRKEHIQWDKDRKSGIAQPSIRNVEQSIKPEQAITAVNVSPLVNIPKKPRAKSKNALFLESLDYFFAKEGHSAKARATLMAWVKNTKTVSLLADGNKEKLSNILYEYIQQASPEELEKFESLVMKLIEATEEKI